MSNLPMTRFQNTKISFGWIKKYCTITKQISMASGTAVTLVVIIRIDIVIY